MTKWKKNLIFAAVVLAAAAVLWLTTRPGGSGKTAVLIARAGYLIAGCGVPPGAVLTIPAALLAFWLVQRIHDGFRIDNGVV